MIIYNVTVNIDDSVHDEWLTWMKEVHIPDVMKTGLFTDNRIMKLLEPDHGEGNTYAIQYTCNTREDLDEYMDDFAPALQEIHSQKYADKFVAFRTILEVI